MRDAAPAHEYADDYSAWTEGRAAHARRWQYANELVSALIAAAHAQPSEQRQPTRQSHTEHLIKVAHFAAVVRESRANAARYQLPVPRISPFIARAMAARGVLVSEVEEAAV